MNNGFQQMWAKIKVWNHALQNGLSGNRSSHTKQNGLNPGPRKKRCKRFINCATFPPRNLSDDRCARRTFRKKNPLLWRWNVLPPDLSPVFTFIYLLTTVWKGFCLSFNHVVYATELCNVSDKEVIPPTIKPYKDSYRSRLLTSLAIIT